MLAVKWREFLRCEAFRAHLEGQAALTAADIEAKVQAFHARIVGER